MADKRFLVYGFDADEIKEGLDAKKDSFDTEGEAKDYASCQEFDNIEIFDRFDAKSDHKRFLVFTYGYESTNGGLGDLKSSADTLDEASIIAKENNDEYIVFYDSLYRRSCRNATISWYSGQ